MIAGSFVFPLAFLRAVYLEAQVHPRLQDLEVHCNANSLGATCFSGSH